MQQLEWNFQHLAARQRSRSAGELFDRNIDLLLAFSAHRSAGVRRRSRLILSRFAVLELFDSLAEAIVRDSDSPEAQVKGEDVMHLANLLKQANARAAQLSAAGQREHSAGRDRAIRAAFARIAAISPQHRETFYARLLAEHPSLLAEGLLKVQTWAQAARAGQALQHLRYLLHLRRRPRPGVERSTQIELTRAAAGMMVSPHLSVRQQVAAGLDQDAPLILAGGAARALETIDDDAPAAARFLVKTMLTCLEGLESAPGGLAAPPVRDVVGPDPLRSLAPALRRKEHDIQAMVAAMLTPRDRALLVELAAAEIQRRLRAGRLVDTHLTAILGDAMQRGLEGVAPVREAGWSALARTLGQQDEAVSLLAGRYLVEMGQIDRIGDRANGQRALQRMLELARDRARRGDTP
jgi:hypothetical protein